VCFRLPGCFGVKLLRSTRLSEVFTGQIAKNAAFPRPQGNADVPLPMAYLALGYRLAAYQRPDFKEVVEKIASSNRRHVRPVVIAALAESFDSRYLRRLVVLRPLRDGVQPGCLSDVEGEFTVEGRMKFAALRRYASA